jgi:hypothetical protein
MMAMNMRGSFFAMRQVAMAELCVRPLAATSGLRRSVGHRREVLLV